MAKYHNQRRRSSIRKEFTEKELTDLRTAFNLIDKNQDGIVTADELQYMLNKLDIYVDEDVAQDLIKCASRTGHELLDENDFLQWVKKIQELRPEEPVDDETAKNIMAAFRVFDLDNDGYITKDELRKAMDIIGEPVTENQLNEFMKMADIDKNGKIDYEEFARLLL